MNCAIHSDTPAVAYCRTCGKPLCSACKHEVRGVVYCEDCIAARLGDTIPAAVPGVGGTPTVIMPVSSGPSPGLAAILGFIPGVGAMYNGQFVKAIVHVGIFVTLIWATDHVNDLFGMGIGFWVFYMVFDAYQTAKARLMGTTPPDPLGLDRMFGQAEPPPPAPGAPVGFAPAAGGGQAAAGAQPAGYANTYTGEDLRHVPTGAFVLIGLGVLFLLNSFGVFRWYWTGQFWPVILIAMGIWIWVRRTGPGIRS